jgi:hypothetical protein
MIENLDEIDEVLIDRVYEAQGSPMIDVIRPLLLHRSEGVLRSRIRGLALRGIIRTVKTIHGTVRCFPNENEKCQMLPASGGANKTQTTMQTKQRGQYVLCDNSL